MTIERVLARVRRDGFADLPIAGLVEQVCGELGHQWRDRLLTPLVTVRLFVLQALHANTAVNHLRHLAGFAFSACSPHDQTACGVPATQSRHSTCGLTEWHSTRSL